MTKEIQSTHATFQTLQDPQVFTAIANQIKSHVKENGLIQNIKGKQYPLVEAWQFAGALLGLFPRVVSLERIGQMESVIKYRCTVEVFDVHKDKAVGSGVAICSNEENSKKYFDEYAIASMAQTRATGKAFRLLLGWLLKASGFDPTPAEEMDSHNTPTEPTNQQMKKEYKEVFKMALEYCVSASHVEQLIKKAGTFKDDAQVIDFARACYKDLRDGNF
jgi:hypothetical protein